jgi:hypothetical protein
MDEKSKQLLRETRCPLPAQPRVPLRQDYEYERAGTCNIFVVVEPRGKKRHVHVTERRTKEDLVGIVCRMLRRGYSEVRKVHLVLDNLNTHLRGGFVEILGKEAAASILRRIQFQYTPVRTAAGRTWPRSRSASSSASAPRAMPPTKPLSPPKWRRGSDDATLPSAAPSGRSRAKTRTGSCVDIIFRSNVSSY